MLGRCVVFTFGRPDSSSALMSTKQGTSGGHGQMHGSSAQGQRGRPQRNDLNAAAAAAPSELVGTDPYVLHALPDEFIILLSGDLTDSFVSIARSLR